MNKLFFLLRLNFLFILLFLSFSSNSFSQVIDEDGNEEAIKEKKPMVVEMDSLEDDDPTIELNPGAPEEQAIIKKKKKKKKNVFWGIKTKRQYTRSLSKGRVVFELFYSLPEYEKPDPYSPLKYYFNLEEKKIERQGTSNPKYGLPLHGTYVKIVDKDTVTTGQFYKGTLTGRWVWYGKNKDIKDKKFYYMGFPKDAEITYYDSKQTKVKEVIPYQLGELSGIYQSFYENGRKKMVGSYKYGYKIGDWTEYYDAVDKRGKQRKHRITKYRNKNNVYRKDYSGPKIKYEWDEKGKVLRKSK
ncbi:toxin-antitoxin system YwqK family antitoxin [Flammeovirga kamogawensis]|uniref:Toxin-antitoxin system YwqK family antitoxin n=1 Tax=Flammeovirga kamogawensis TaxID=373891 RepID=A0ABX8GS12_9BACT|nr:hypothetical protein [Flammeovirga kamogawensis]MBB6461481.1 antitoxin component YwqK of YwqJK toxin-antitoxin module [Flammeovirga kamogawensis]QWG06373.1 hypothetical protein KM029_13665 [Flammeovirga kamogawensis]TRX68202.1 hypothetical protein EO216_08680 [Flammeovirga kamogawensis]